MFKINNNLKLNLENSVITDSTGSIVCQSQAPFHEGNRVIDVVQPGDTIEYCEDGTVIRAYNYENTWYTATTKCIDASLNKFSSERSFAELFHDIFDVEDYNLLDPKKTYIFILRHPENRIIVPHKKPSLVYVMSIENATGVYDYDMSITKETKTHFDTLEIITDVNPGDSIDHLLVSKYTPSKKGLLIRNGKNYNMYTFEEYSLLKEVRGDTPLVTYRYMELIHDTENLHKLRMAFPEYLDKFAKINKAIYMSCREAYNLYMNSHVFNKIKIDDTHEYYHILKIFHKTYKNSKSKILQFEDAIGSFYKIHHKQMLTLQNIRQVVYS